VIFLDLRALSAAQLRVVRDEIIRLAQVRNLALEVIVYGERLARIKFNGDPLMFKQIMRNECLPEPASNPCRASQEEKLKK
jgi:hypothetical protein